MFCWTAALPQTFHNRSRWRSKQIIFLHPCLQRSSLLCFQLIWEALPGLGWHWTYCKKRLETSRNPGYRSVTNIFWAEITFIKMVQSKLRADSVTQNQMEHLSYSWKEARGKRGRMQLQPLVLLQLVEGSQDVSGCPRVVKMIGWGRERWQVWGEEQMASWSCTDLVHSLSHISPMVASEAEALNVCVSPF